MMVVPIVWGASFIIIKLISLEVPIFWMQFFRVLLAFIGILPFMRKRDFEGFQLNFLWKGMLPGLMYFLAITFQSYGLQTISAGKAGLISGLNVIVVPILARIILKTKISLKITIAVMLALLGRVLMDLNFSDLSLTQSIFTIGDLYIFLATLAVSLQIIFITQYCRTINPKLFSLLQFSINILLCGVFALITAGEFNFSQLTLENWGVITYLGLIGSSLPFLIQNWGQKRISATTTGILYATTPIWSMIFGLIIGHEIITWKHILGAFFIILGAMYAILITQKSEKKNEKQQLELK